MSYPINQKINPYQQPAMGVNSINAPQLQDVNADTIAQGIDQNSVLKGVGGGEEEKNKWMTPVLTLPVWGVMCLAMDQFNKACGGEYKKSMLGRLNIWGENLGKELPFIDVALKKISSLKSLFMDKVVTKSKILSAFFNTPAIPKNKMALTMSKGTIAEISTEAVQRLEKHLQSGGTLKLNIDGKDITDAKQIEAYVKGLSEKTHTEDGIKEIINLFKQQSKEGCIITKKVGKIPFTNGQKYISDVIPGLEKLMNRKIYFSEFTNKLNSFGNPLEVTTTIGKRLPKAVIRTVEGITNGTAGGKVAILMAAYFIADAIKKTIDAPKGNGEKGKTFAENNIYNLGWYLTMPFGMGLLYKTGGLKYIGLGENQVKEYRRLLNEFNDRAKSGQIKDKALYNSEKKALQGKLKEILKQSATEIKSTDGFGTKVGKTLKNIFYKPLQWGAKVLTAGLEQPESFNPKAIGKSSNLMEKVQQFFQYGKAKNVKGFAGAALRFSLFMFTIAPFLGKFFAKGSHIVFGKPTKSVLDDEETPKKNQPLTIPQQNAISQAQLQQTQMPQNQTQLQPLTVMQPIQQDTKFAHDQVASAPRENLVDMYKTQPTVERNMMLVQEGPVRTYVPSSEPVKVKAKEYSSEDKQDENKAADVLSKADKAERMASKYLS